MLDGTRYMTKLELKPRHKQGGSEHGSSAPVGFLDSPSHAGRGRNRFFDSPVPSEAHDGGAASSMASPSNAASAETQGKLRQFATSQHASSPSPMSPAAAQLRATLTWLPSVEVLIRYDREEYYESKATTPAITGARVYLSLGDYESTEKLAWAVLERHKLNPLLMYQAYMLIARAATAAQKLEEAHKMQLQAAEIAAKAHFRFLKARALVGLADPVHITRAQKVIATLKSDPRELGGVRVLLSPGA